jgi:peptidoglycan hydrolase-like protein with peptidoglycan-binding domain
VRFATRPENRRRLVWSTAIAVMVSVTAGAGLVLTSGDDASVGAAPEPSTAEPTTTTIATAVDAETHTAMNTSSTSAERSIPTATSSATAIDPALDVSDVIGAAAVAATTTMPAATLTAGSPRAEVAELQRQLNLVTGSTLETDGVYGAGTRAAIVNFQTVIGVAPTGVADAVTRWTLAEAANRVVRPTIGAGGINGCQVAVIGDSLMAGAEQLHADAIARVGCAAAVDGEGGRSLVYGWQCRVDRDGRRPLLVFEDRIPGNDTCAPSGLTLLASWADASALGDVVVIALGTNDSGLYDKTRWQNNWAEAIRLAGGRPVVFVTAQAGPGSAQYARQNTYTAALRQWCSGQRLCVIAEWGNTAAAADPASYVDTVHLNIAGTRARAAFIADVVAALLTGRPIPNPQPPPTPTIPPAVTTTSVATTPGTTTTTPSNPTTSTTITSSSTTSPTTTTTPAATTTSTTSTTTTTSTTSTTTTTTLLEGPPDSTG